MTESLHSGEYRACPFCSELIRTRAIKCKHCAGEIDPRRVREYGGGGRNNPWHLTVLGILLALTAFIVAYPTIVANMEKRALAKAMIEKATSIPEGPRPSAAKPRVVQASAGAPGLAKLNFGEDAELEVGQTYSGITLLDLLEASASDSRVHPEGRITVEFAGASYEIRTRLPALAPEGRYQIVGIEETAR
jgi:hypothetical protein